jgi:hypothetical protein
VEICGALLVCRHTFRVSTIIILNLEDKFHQLGLGDCLIFVAVYFTSLCALKSCEENCTALIGVGRNILGLVGLPESIRKPVRGNELQATHVSTWSLRRLSTFVTFGIQGSVEKSGSS